MANLGDMVCDEVSGFKGVVLAKMEAMFEATQVRIHPRALSDSGGIQPGVWIEEERVSVIEDCVVVGFKNVAGKAEAASMKAKQGEANGQG